MPNQVFLETEIQQYAHDLLATHVVLEYGYQIDEWKKYINRVLDAQRLAHDEQEDVLKKVIKNIQEQEQKVAMLGMLALSLLGGVALSWLSGAIQYKLFPKLAGKWKLNKTGVYLEKHTSKGVSVGNNFLMIKSELDYNKVTAKIFGDAAANVGRPIIDRFINQNIIKRGGTTTLNNIDGVSIDGKTSSSELYQSLKTQLENSLLDEKQKTTKQIADSAITIRNSPEFGKNILNDLYKKKPSLSNMNDDIILRDAKKSVEDFVDVCRKMWAENWFYYGCNPPNTSIYEMSRRLEREMWALWIIEQGYSWKTEKRKSYGYLGKERETYEHSYIDRRDDGIPFHEFIATRLVILNVIQAQNWKVRQSQEVSRSHFEPRYKSPDIRVVGAVDDVAEITAINNWANNHQLEMLSGQHESQKRILGSVLNIHTQ